MITKEALAQALQSPEVRDYASFSDHEVLADHIWHALTQPVAGSKPTRWQCSACRRNQNQCARSIDVLGVMCCNDCDHDL